MNSSVLLGLLGAGAAVLLLVAHAQLERGASRAVANGVVLTGVAVTLGVVAGAGLLVV